MSDKENKDKGIFSSFYPKPLSDEAKKEKEKSEKDKRDRERREKEKREKEKKFETKESSRIMEDIAVQKTTKEPKYEELVTSPNELEENSKTLETKSIKGDVGPIYRKSSINLIEQKKRGVSKYFK